MQSNERLYWDRAEQDDFFDADLTDAHQKLRNQTENNPLKAENGNGTSDMAERFMRTLHHIE
jgi:hypothetical protein